jgi:hypothetical protein
MAWFTYKCEKHGPFRKALPKREPSYSCPECGLESKNVLKIGNSMIMERLDNGVMARAVERLHNIEEIIEERDLNDKKREGLVDDDGGELV